MTTDERFEAMVKGGAKALVDHYGSNPDEVKVWRHDVRIALQAAGVPGLLTELADERERADTWQDRYNDFRGTSIAYLQAENAALRKRVERIQSLLDSNVTGMVSATALRQALADKQEARDMQNTDGPFDEVWAEAQNVE